MHRTAWRNCLKIPDKLRSGLPRAVKGGQETQYRRLECHRIHTLGSLLAIFQTVSLGSTLAIWPCNTLHRFGALQTPLRLLRVVAGG
jgi:hypothetical protein